MTDANYRGLQVLQDKYGSQKFAVLAFPCNQFGGQEPGSSSDIEAFAAKYSATFPMFEKVDVNGPNTHPLFAYLKGKKGELLGADIKWNFAKFLVGRDGSVINRYAPTSGPESIDADIAKALAQPMKAEL